MTIDFQWNPEQKRALDEIQAWVTGPFVKMMSLTGAAGTGKTSILSTAKDYFGSSVAWSAMTGKAAFRMSEAAGVKATTLHSVLYDKPLQNKDKLHFYKLKKPKCKILAIDESSMITPTIYLDLKKWEQQGVKILFIGDGFQLPPILSTKEAAEFGEDFVVFRDVKGPNLTKVMRSGDGIIDIATVIREECRIPSVGNDSVEIVRDRTPGLRAINDYFADSEDHALVTWTNKLRMQGNNEVRRRLKKVSVLPEAREPIMICKNGQNVLNGEVAEVLSFRDGPRLGEVNTKWMKTTGGDELLVSVQGKDYPVDGFMPYIKDWKAYGVAKGNQKYPDPLPITYGYVYTCHKIQGSQCRRVSAYLAESDLNNDHFNKMTALPDGGQAPMSIRWIYTSLTRSTTRASLILGG